MKQKKIELEKLDLPFEEQKDQVEFIKVDCPSCSEQVSAGNIDLESKIGKCSNCNALFSLQKEIGGLQTALETNDKIQRPEGVELYSFSNELEIELEQPYPILDTIILSLFPMVLLFAMLLYFIKGEDPGLTVFIISTLFIAKSVFRLIRSKRYKTNLIIDDKTVSVLHRPKEFKKDKVFNVEDIDQVYVGTSSSGIGLFFVINSVDGQRREKVLERAKNYTHLKYVEQEIEQYLKIENRKITGEV